jgi:hypothetical protein
MCRRGRTIRQCQARPQQHKPALIGHAPLPGARDASPRPRSFNRRDPNRVIGRANDFFDAMFRVKPFTEPDRFYRREITLVLPRVASFSDGTVGARIMMTPEGVSRLECRNVCIAVFTRLVHSLKGVFHPKEISAPIMTISINNRIWKGGVHQTSWAIKIRVTAIPTWSLRI